MTLRALYDDCETHQSPQLSFPRRRESTHEFRAAKRQSRNRQLYPHCQCSAVEDYARRGACPPLGSGWGMAETPVGRGRKKRNAEFSSLGVPAPARMSDWYENSVRRLLMASISVLTNWPARMSHYGECDIDPESARISPLPHSPIRPPFVIPAKAGIQRGGEGLWRCVKFPVWGADGLLRAHRSPDPPRADDNHPFMRPSQGHGDSGKRPAPYADTGPESKRGLFGAISSHRLKYWLKIA